MCDRIPSNQACSLLSEPVITIFSRTVAQKAPITQIFGFSAFGSPTMSAGNSWKIQEFEGAGGLRESCRLLRFQRHWLLQNVSTGEVLSLEQDQEVVIEAEQEQIKVVSCVDDEEKTVVKALKEVFELHLEMEVDGEDAEEEEEEPKVVLRDGSICATISEMTEARDLMALSLQMPGLNCNWDVEMCMFHLARSAVPLPLSSLAFVLRWAIDCLGSAKNSNFIGSSSTAWRNLLAKYYKALVPQEGKAAEAAFADLCESSWALKKVEEARGFTSVSADDKAAGLLADAVHNDWHVSPFGMLVLLTEWCSKDVRANSSWLLQSSEIRSRARGMLKGILSTFCDTEFVRLGQTAQEGDHQFDLRWRIVEGEVLVDLAALVDGCKSLRTTFASGQEEMEMTVLLTKLRVDERSNMVTAKRRQLYVNLQSYIFLCLSDIMESSIRSDSIWKRTKVEQLSQLRRAL